MTACQPRSGYTLPVFACAAAVAAVQGARYCRRHDVFDEINLEHETGRQFRIVELDATMATLVGSVGLTVIVWFVAYLMGGFR